jgi:hypothetical protein
MAAVRFQFVHHTRQNVRPRQSRTKKAAAQAIKNNALGASYNLRRYLSELQVCGEIRHAAAVRKLYRGLSVHRTIPPTYQALGPRRHRRIVNGRLVRYSSASFFGRRVL